MAKYKFTIHLTRYLLLIKDTNTHTHTVYMNSTFVK